MRKLSRKNIKVGILGGTFDPPHIGHLHISKIGIKKLKLNKILIDGPNSPDSLFTKENIENYDCFICIYHDQALIPFKLLSEFKGVNYTGSLDVIRTSPDHGTAYNLQNKNNANDSSLFNSFILADKIYQNRLRY